MKEIPKMPLEIALKNIDIMGQRFVGNLQEHETMQMAIHTVKEALAPKEPIPMNKKTRPNEAG